MKTYLAVLGVSTILMILLMIGVSYLIHLFFAISVLKIIAIIIIGAVLIQVGQLLIKYGFFGAIIGFFYLKAKTKK